MSIEDRKLWLSAEHYLENWQDPERADIHSRSCPCCQSFLDEDECFACPIYKHTGKHGCANTPWGTCSYTQVHDSLSSFKNALEKEYIFLVGLALRENS